MFIRRFDLELTFRFLKQSLGWTRPHLGKPVTADRVLGDHRDGHTAAVGTSCYPKPPAAMAKAIGSGRVDASTSPVWLSPHLPDQLRFRQHAKPHSRWPLPSHRPKKQEKSPGPTPSESSPKVI